MVSRFSDVLATWLVVERTHWALWLPGCLGIGFGGYFGMSPEPSIYAGILATAAVALMGWRLRRRGVSVLVIAIALATVAAGFTIAQLRTITVDAPVLAKRIGPTMIEARVLRVQHLEKGYRLVLDRLAIPRL